MSTQRDAPRSTSGPARAPIAHTSLPVDARGGQGTPTSRGAGIDATIQTLLTELCGERRAPQDAEAFEVLLARATWSRVSEPGDAVAGALVALLGPVEALTVITHNRVGRARLTDLQQAGESSVPSQRQLAAARQRWLPRLDRAATVRDLETALRHGLTLLTPESPEWPERLASLGVHTPHALWVRGHEQALAATRSLAVVGARACTGYGSHVTAELTAEASAAGLTIVSGAAYGVDAVAHRAALAAESPTVAVLAGGADRPYPAAHDRLLERIAETGAVCSELVPGAAPTKWRFLQRNRVIAALADAVLVTEAGYRSGTLNTAGHAAELGTPLGAVPGPVTSAASAGCHRLIREYGAALVTNGEDVRELAGVPSASERSSGSPAGRHSALHVRLLDALPLRGSRSAEEAALQAGVTPAEARMGFAELELLGHVARHTPPTGGDTSWRLIQQSRLPGSAHS